MGSQMTKRLMKPLLVFFLLITASCTTAGGRQNDLVLRSYPSDPTEQGKLLVRSYPLNPYNRYLDGQWQCSILASDGNCYFASSTHSHSVGSSFFKYDPLKKELTCLCKDVQKLGGKMGIPREKLHTDIDEANGWLYFASRTGSPGPGQKEGGGQALGYEMATGKFRNYGTVHPGHSIYAGIGADAKRSRLWVMALSGLDSGDCRLYWIDMETGQKKLFAEISPGGACFYMFVDPQGDCWFSIRGSKGTVFCARMKSGKLERFDNALPGGADWWSWAQPLDDGKRCVLLAEVGHTKPGSKFWIFDTTKAGKPEAFKFVREVGRCGLGNALAGNRLYFVQGAAGKIWSKRRGGRSFLRLHSIVLDGEGEHELVNHGVITDQDGRYPMRIHALAADKKGRVYMTGDWHLLPGEKGTDKSTNRVGRIMNRGQFFAVVDLSKDAKK